MRGVILLLNERLLYRRRTSYGRNVYNPVNDADDFNFNAGTIRHGRYNFFTATLRKLTDGLGLGNDVYFGIHVDLPTALVYVADMLRFCCRHGNFFIFVKLGKFNGKNFSRTINVGIDNGADIFILADTFYSSRLLLYVLALLIAGVVNGSVPHKLA